VHEQACGADLEGGWYVIMGEVGEGEYVFVRGKAFVKERYRPQRYVREHMFVGRCRYQRSACA